MLIFLYRQEIKIPISHSPIGEGKGMQIATKNIIYWLSLTILLNGLI